MQILTIGIVTRPFRFEGPRKNTAAEKGIVEMRQYCDTVIEILNDKIRDLFGNMPMNQAFAQADHILSTSAKSLSEIITVPGIINVDFKDIETTMKDSGTAVMGSAIAKGDNRALKAVQEAISSPLLNNNEIEGATKVLLAITYGHAPELTMDEFDEITAFIGQRTGANADVIFGTTMNPELGDSVQVTVVATGFTSESEALGPYGKEIRILDTRPGVHDTHFGSGETAAPAQPGPSAAAQVQTNGQPLFTAPPVSQPEPVRVMAQAPAQNQHNVPFQYPPAPGNGSPQPMPGEAARTQSEIPAGQQPLQQPIQPEQPEPYQYVDINGNFQLMYQSPENVDRPLEKVDQLISQRSGFGRQNTRNEALRNLSANSTHRPDFNDPEYIRQNELPAYLRKYPNFAMPSGPPSPDAMSRYTINENSEILDNNRYLHNNVD
jgi:cell division protein FtsZ